jgi:hypothetical protein
MGRGTVTFLRSGGAEFKSVSPEWVNAFRGGRDALEGVDVFLRVDATHMVAFATRPERYPGAWARAPL